MNSVLKRAQEIDQQRSADLMQKQSDINKLAEWNSQCNDLRHLMERDIDNLPSEMDFRIVDFMLHVFKKD